MLSLRAFHIFFISVSIVFLGWFAAWNFENGTRAMGAGSAVFAVLAAAYLFCFVRKGRPGSRR